MVDVAGICTGPEAFYETAAECLCVELPLTRDRLQQNQGTIAVVSLIAWLFAGTVRPAGGRAPVTPAA